jgi:hypothetical protein
MAADVAISRHYVGLCISNLAVIVARPDITGLCPKVQILLRVRPHRSLARSGLSRPADAVTILSTLRLSFRPFTSVPPDPVSQVSRRSRPWQQMEHVIAA